jgi:hypothetical protein
MNKKLEHFHNFLTKFLLFKFFIGCLSSLIWTFVEFKSHQFSNLRSSKSQSLHCILNKN